MFSKKRLLALTLAATMVMGSSVTAFADEGSQTGTGDIEGIVNTDVFSVVLPTATDATYKFILDPQGLIKATNSAAYSGATFTGNNLYFNSAADTYGDTSAVLTAVNKSSFGVDINLKATLTGYDGLTVASSASDATSETDDPAIYLAIKKEAGTVAHDAATPSIALTNSATSEAIAVSEGVAAANVTMTLAAPAADENSKPAYVYSYADDEYSYELNSAWEGNFNGVAFALTGAINTYDPTSASTVDGWADLANITPSVNVVWSIENPNANAGPSIATTSYTMTSGESVEVPFSLGAGEKAATGITKITYKNSSNAVRDLDSSNYAVANNKITFTSTYTDGLISANVTSRVFTVVFDDDEATSVNVTLATE